MTLAERITVATAAVTIVVMSLVFGPSPEPLVCLVNIRPAIGSCPVVAAGTIAAAHLDSR